MSIAHAAHAQRHDPHEILLARAASIAHGGTAEAAKPVEGEAVFGVVAHRHRAQANDMHRRKPRRTEKRNMRERNEMIFLKSKLGCKRFLQQ